MNLLKIIWLIKITSFAFINTAAQTNCNTKFLEAKYDEINILQNIPYQIAKNFIGNNKTYHLDLYEAKYDTNTKRPLIVFFYGGGFIQGNKEQPAIVEMCDSFAKRGYVAAAINYRLGTNGSSSSMIRAIYRGVQDGSAALRFLSYHADLFKIDTNNIVLAGNSAGAFVAMHLAFLQDNERPTESYGNNVTSDLGCISCSGNLFPQHAKPKAVIDLWGALYDSTIRGINDSIPLLVYHGSEDPSVPFDKGKPYNISTLTSINGALPIYNQSIENNLPVEFNPIYGSGHGPWGGKNGEFTSEHPKTPFFSRIVNNMLTFSQHHLKPKNKLQVKGERSPNVGKIYRYIIKNKKSTNSYSYSVVGGDLVSKNDSSITIIWHHHNNPHIILTEVNQIGLCGEATTFNVKLDDIPLQVYPNPTSNSFNINNSNLNINNVIVLNINGKELINISQKFEKNINIDLSYYPKGMYLVKIITENQFNLSKINRL